MEQNVICCIWRSNRDLNPNYSHKTDFFLLFWPFIYLFIYSFFQNKKTKNKNDPLFPHFRVGHWGQHNIYFWPYLTLHVHTRCLKIKYSMYNHYCCNIIRLAKKNSMLSDQFYFCAHTSPQLAGLLMYVTYFFFKIQTYKDIHTF